MLPRLVKTHYWLIPLYQERKATLFYCLTPLTLYSSTLGDHLSHLCHRLPRWSCYLIYHIKWLNHLQPIGEWIGTKTWISFLLFNIGKTTALPFEAVLSECVEEPWHPISAYLSARNRIKSQASERKHWGRERREGRVLISSQQVIMRYSECVPMGAWMGKVTPMMSLSRCVLKSHGKHQRAVCETHEVSLP